MSSSIFGSLYAVVADGEPIYRCSLLFLTNALTPGQLLNYIDIRQPTVAGYAPIEAPNVTDLFPSPEIVNGKAAILVSKQIDMRNDGDSDVAVTGVALVLWKDAGRPFVVSVVPAPLTWRRGDRIGGRFRITSNIYTEP